jgi:hypothetical protein
LPNILTQPVSSLAAPGAEFKAALTFSKGGQWVLPDLPLTFSVSANASADVAILTSGPLFQYTDGLTNPQQVTVNVPAGTAYIKIEFEVGVQGNLSAQANLSATVGVSGSAQAGVNFKVGYYKAISPTTTVENAIIQTVQSFTLPFHNATLRSLGNGDYLYHNFAGNLALGFGVNFGVNGTLLTARSVQEVIKAFGSPIASASLGASPKFKASAGIDLSYKHMDFFEMLLHRTTTATADTAEVHLFRADKSNFSLGFDAAINVDLGAHFNISTNLGTVVDQISQHVTEKLTDSTVKSTVDGLVHKVFDPATQAVQNFVDDANQKVNALLQDVNNRGIELKATLETQKSRVSLFNYTFDLKNNNADTAWKAAVKGDFVTAYETPGGPVQIAPDSGVEQEFVRRSSISLNLFGLFQVQSITQFFTSSTLVYAGNGIFNLLFKTGIEWDTTSQGRESIASVTFSASATSQALINIQQLQVEMNLQLTDNAKPDAANVTAGVLEDSSMTALQAVGDQARDFIAANSGGSFSVQIALEPSAYTRLRANRFINNRPPALPQTADAQNYAAFVQACRDLLSADAFGGFPEIGRNFSDWQRYNMLGNQESIPNRHDFPFLTNDIPGFFPGGLSSNQRSTIAIYIQAAQRFMNLCDDLSQLALQLPGVDTPNKFNAVTETLKFMVKNDLNIFFTKPMLLALLRITQSSIDNLQSSLGTSSSAPQLTVSFKVD